MATLEVTFQTGGDDLRGGSWANITVKLFGKAPIILEKFTGVDGLAGGSVVTRSADVPGLSDPSQIEYFQIEHVSQESFGQTRDNWSMDGAKFVVRLGRFPAVVAEQGFHRFTGNSANLTVFPLSG